MTRPRLIATGVIASSALAAGSAGLLAGPAAASSSQVLHLTANPHGALMFNTKHLTAAHPGRITIVLRNPRSSGIPHGIGISGHGVNVRSRNALPGRSVSVTATLRKGNYTFYCPVPGHAQAGMRGTLTVR